MGVLLCASKDDDVVEYALARTSSPTLVAEYQTMLPSRDVLRGKLHEIYGQLAGEGEGEGEGEADNGLVAGLASTAPLELTRQRSFVARPAEPRMVSASCWALDPPI